MKYLFAFFVSFFTMVFSYAQSSSPGIYCTADYTDIPSNSNDYIDSIVFNNGYNTTNAQFAFPHYVHYPYLDTLIATGYNHYKVYFNNASTTIFYGVWIDFNIDGDFNDFGENIKTSQTNSSFIVDSFLTPATVPTSLQYRMRVRVSNSAVTQTSSCGSLSSGETEDYTLVMATPTAIGNVEHYSIFDITQNYIDKSLNINYKGSGQMGGILKIFNIYGQLVNSKNIYLNKSTHVFLNDMSSGTYSYILVDKNGHKLKSGKLIF